MQVNTISFAPDYLRDAAKCLVQWFGNADQQWLLNEATDTELTMIGTGIVEDDRLWSLVNRLLREHTEQHRAAVAAGNIDPDDIA